MDGLYYSYSACEDDQTFPKAFPAAGYDKDNSAVILNSYATYSKQVSIARILGYLACYSDTLPRTVVAPRQRNQA